MEIFTSESLLHTEARLTSTVSSNDAGRQRRTRVHVQLAYGLDAVRYRERWAKGLEPDETPYGFHHAEKFGFTVGFSRDSPLLRTVPVRLFRRFFRIDPVHALLNLRQIRNADVIWTMTEHQAFGVATLFALGLARRRPIIGNAVWLWNEWNRLPRIKKAFFRYLSRYIDVLTVHSADCLETARRTFPNVRCKVSYFGINTSLFQPAATTPSTADRAIQIFSAGTDRTRDWATFFRAFGNDARFEVRVAAPTLSAEELKSYGNVQLVQNPTMATFLHLYSKADFIVIPMHHNIFSGITVALEAAALKRPLVVSRTGGVPTYFEDQDVFYVAPGDFRALRDAVLTATPSERRARTESAWDRFQKQDFSTKGMMRRYADLTSAILSSRA